MMGWAGMGWAGLGWAGGEGILVNKKSEGGVLDGGFLVALQVVEKGGAGLRRENDGNAQMPPQRVRVVRPASATDAYKSSAAIRV
ncbi:hypothetical protein ACLOJK_011137 [Asimina triloba]